MRWWKHVDSATLLGKNGFLFWHLNYLIKSFIIYLSTNKGFTEFQSRKIRAFFLQSKIKFFSNWSRFLIENGANSLALTLRKERPIDLVDLNNFRLTTLLLNAMKTSQLKNNVNAIKEIILKTRETYQPSEDLVTSSVLKSSNSFTSFLDSNISDATDNGISHQHNDKKKEPQYNSLFKVLQNIINLRTDNQYIIEQIEVKANIFSI